MASSHHPGRRRVLRWAASLMTAAVVMTAGSGAIAQNRYRYPYPYPAARVQPAIPDATAVPSSSVLGIISGGLAGTYIRIAADIASVIDGPTQRLRVLPIVGKGSLQNISDILNVRDVDVAIVQSDVLAFLRQRQE